MGNTSRSISFHLESVQISQFQEIEQRFPQSAETDTQLSYMLSLTMAFDQEKLRMSVGVDVQVYLGDQSADSPDPGMRVAGVRTVSHYLIPEDDLDKRADGKVLLPKMFVAHLVGLSISTSRGVLVGRAHHPAFRSAPLPIGRPLDAVDEVVREGHVDWIDVEG